MAIRGDITVDWAASPRIVTVAAPSAELTLQDLRDTLRDMEMSEEGILYPPLLKVSGKENLGGGRQVGMTVVLLNAKIAFEARPGPSWVLCTISGGNILAVDNLGATMDVREPTAYVSADRESSTSASIVTTGGSALTTDEHNALMAIPDETLTTAEHDQLMGISPSGLTQSEHDQLMAVPLGTLSTAEHDQLMAIPLTDNGGLTQAEHDQLMAVPLTEIGMTQAEHDQLMAIPTTTGGLTTDEHDQLMAIPLDSADDVAVATLMQNLEEIVPHDLPAIPTVAEALMLLYMAVRNKTITTQTKLQLHNDAGNVVGESTISDNGTTMTREKLE